MASPAPPLKEAVGGLDREPFVALLAKLIGETQRLQNDPPELVPQEELVAQHVLDVLLPVSTDTGGGPLLVRKVNYTEGRSNVIVEYPGTVPGRVVSFVGMHMDVVPANPNEWVSSLYLDGAKIDFRVCGCWTKDFSVCLIWGRFCPEKLAPYFAVA
jgi:acetylornithine deacetylase